MRDKCLFFVLSTLLFCGQLTSLVSCGTQRGDVRALAVNTEEPLELRVKALNAEGVALRNQSQYREALNIHFEALRLAQEIDDTTGQIFALNNIGTDLRRSSSNQEASTYHYSALELCGSNPEYLKSRAVAMNGLGNIFLSLNKPDQALDYLERSLVIEKELNSRLGQAINYANMGEAFHQKHMLDSALFYFNASLAENRAIPSDIGIALCKKSLGEIHLEEGRTQAGLNMIREAVTLLGGSKDACHRVEVEAAFCSALLDNGRLEEAESHLKELLALAHVVSSYDQLYTAYGLLADLKERQREYRDALWASRRMADYRDSLFLQNDAVRVVELESRFDSRQAARQIRWLEAEKTLTAKIRKRENGAFFLVIFILAILLAVLYHWGKSRRRLAAELKHVSDMKTCFFTNVSHEFRTPLTLIKAPVEHLLEKGRDRNMTAELGIVLRNTNYMLFLVEQILNISRIDAGKFTICRQADDLARSIRSISDSFASLAAEKEIAFHREVEPSGHVWFDPNIVQILVVNLLSNAIKFAPEKGMVTMRTRNRGDVYELSFENDTQKSFTKTELKQIFTRFYTTAGENGKGTGIGLALVKEICALYHAGIDLSYGDGRIRILVSLPVEKAECLAPDSHESVSDNLPAEVADKSASRSRKLPIILIVEDNGDMLLFLKNILQEEYRIVSARDGGEGIEKARETVPDIILSDVLMPNMNGLTLLETLKADYRTSHIPVILLTALCGQEDMVKGLESKADDYIVKPFNTAILRIKIKNQLNYRDILVKKYKESSEGTLPETEVLSRDSGFASLLEKISSKISDPGFGVDEFCEFCFMSRTQLHRKLKATTGLSATAYLRFRRVRMAADMLRKTDCTVTDACFSSGFSDASYFSKCFKEELKVSPMTYRKKFFKGSL